MPGSEQVTLAALGVVAALLYSLTRLQDVLQDAIDGGFFTTPESSPSQPQMSRIVETAMQIASAISYLHTQNIIHGSINGASIMLSSVPGADDAVAQVSAAVLKERFGRNLDALPCRWLTLALLFNLRSPSASLCQGQTPTSWLQRCCGTISCLR